jgi:hypothetical protein
MDQGIVITLGSFYNQSNKKCSLTYGENDQLTLDCPRKVDLNKILFYLQPNQQLSISAHIVLNVKMPSVYFNERWLAYNLYLNIDNLYPNTVEYCVLMIKDTGKEAYELKYNQRYVLNLTFNESEDFVYELVKENK